MSLSKGGAPEPEAAAPAHPEASEASPAAPAPAVPGPPAPRGLSTWLSYSLAACSGILYFLAFPGVDLWPLGLVALIPLIVALDGVSPRRGLLLGWTAGLGMTLLGFYWLIGMLEAFSGFGLALSILFMVLLCAYQAGRIALLGWLTARAQVRGWPLGLSFAAGFATSELIYPLLFPWSYAGVVHQVPVLLQTAELGGPILVGLTLVAANLALSSPIRAVIARRTWRVGELWPLLFLLPAVGYGLSRIASVDAVIERAPKAHVGMVQANMGLFAKRRETLKGLRRHVALTRELIQRGARDLVVWSETSVSHAFDEARVESDVSEWLGERFEVPVLLGSVLWRNVEDERGQVLFNSALLLEPDGRVRERYDKQFLLPFGEYLPFGDWLPILYRWSPNSGRFTPGEHVSPLALGSRQIATFICYEDIIPSFVRSVASRGAPDLLVNLTNDAWFGDTTEPWIHLALAQLRAIEHRRAFLRSTNSGVSAIIDPVGRVLQHTQPFEVATLDAEVPLLRGRTVYSRLGDAPFWLLSLLSLAAASLRRPTGRFQRLFGLIRTSSESADEPVASVPPIPQKPANEDGVARFQKLSNHWLRPKARFPEPRSE